MDVYVDRLYAALTDALRQSRDRPFAAPVTVAEIYQDLVPYRVVRVLLGFEMNADYEHALLQLLSGADGLARIEPEEAAAELRSELTSPNPNVGLFRKFAACDVWITDPGDGAESAADAGFAPEPVDEDAATSAHTSAESDDEHAKWRPRASSDAGAAAATDEVLELNADEVVDEETGTAEAARDTPMTAAANTPLRDGPRRCGFCDTPLPAGRLIRFCPHCGGDQTRRPCVECGEPLESGWRFCIACGAAQDA
ncbi:MAG: zinc ribbon domain-containing protein [Longimicrobiales bacterium]